MPRAHRDPEQPADTGHPKAPRAGADPEKTAKLSGEDGGAEEMLRLQQQVAGLREQLRGQEARWSAALRDLQAQLDALKKQNAGRRDGRRPSELRGPEARRSAASPQPRTRSDTLVSKSAFGKMSPLSADEEMMLKRAGRRSRSVPLSERGRSPERVPSSQPVSVTIERVESGRLVSCEDGDKTVSISLRVRRTASAGTGLHSEETPAPSAGAEVLAHRPPQPCRRVSPPGSDSQNPPAGAASSPNTSRPLDPGAEKEGKEEARSPDGKVDEARSSGREAVTSAEGAEKDVGAKATVLRFFSGDVKKVSPDQRVVYYHASARTMRTTHPRGLQVVRLPNKQTEKFHPDGSKEILFPDGTMKRLGDGHEETVFPDGTSVRVDRNGDKTIVFSNGHRDIHTAQFKRREFPDGTIKTVYCNGRQETNTGFTHLRFTCTARGCGNLAGDEECVFNAEGGDMYPPVVQGWRRQEWSHEDARPARVGKASSC
ncbi:T-complex protein 10A homolog 1 [Molossus nigricans]